MTDQEKQQIAIYRNRGLSYTAISRMMEISVNSIKTYCKRNGLGGVRAFEKTNGAEVCACENCGTPVMQNPGRKKKRFCSDKCRNAWWNADQDEVNKKANYDCVCEHCKKPFVSYGNKHRKYCSHECYIEDRFGGAY